MSVRVLAFFAFLGGLGCSPPRPHLVEKGTYKTFRLNRRCSQGPFVFRARVVGARWGEKLELKVHSPRSIKFKAELQIGTRPKRVVEEGAENVNFFCLHNSPGGNAGKGPTAGGQGEPGRTAAPGEPREKAPPPERAELRLIPVPGTQKPDKEVYTIRLYDFQIVRLDGRPELAKGEAVLITLWSYEPVDFQNVYFELRHTVYEPDDEKKWIRYLTEQQQKEFLRAHRFCYSRWRERVKTTTCRQFYDQATYDRCTRPAVLGSRRCWDASLKGVTIEQKKIRVVTYHRPAPVKKKPPRRVVHRKKAPSRAASKPAPVEILLVPESVFITEKDPTEHPPSEKKPPSPLREVQPPRPSRNAMWVDGMWKWSGSKWVWLGGFWRVPRADIDTLQVARAPKLPPSKKVADPVGPSPLAGAQWAAGYWMWTGSGFIWVKGRWVLPASQGMRWIPPRWVRTPRGIYLMPGRWGKK